MVEGLPAGSAELGQRIPPLLSDLVVSGMLMLVGDAYQLQTTEGRQWTQDFQERTTRILNNEGRIAGARTDAIREEILRELKSLTYIQGESRIARKVDLHTLPDKPAGGSGNIPVWVRDEWSTTDKAVRDDARTDGVESPIIFVSLPRRDADLLKQTLARAAAAEETINARGTPPPTRVARPRRQCGPFTPRRRLGARGWSGRSSPAPRSFRAVATS